MVVMTVSAGSAREVVSAFPIFRRDKTEAKLVITGYMILREGEEALIVENTNNVILIRLLINKTHEEGDLVGNM